MRTFGVGLIGTGFMGKSHALACRNARAVLGPDTPAARLELLCDTPAELVGHGRPVRLRPRDRGLARWLRIRRSTSSASPRRTSCATRWPWPSSPPASMSIARSRSS